MHDVVPCDFKKALFNSLIRKPNLGKHELKNYHAISNISFMSKVLEKVVANRLHDIIYSQHMSNNLQSA